MTNNKIIERIIKQYNIPELKIIMEKMSFADLQSLLIEIYNKRSKSISLKQLLEQYKKDRFVAPSKLDPRDLLEFDALAYSLLSNDYIALKLSPVSPLGTTSVVSPISQNMVLTTIRNTEVSSDITNSMALEATLLRKKLLQRKETKNKYVRLCSSHRLLRTQFFENPLFVSHFQIFSICIAGRDEGSSKFEVNALYELLQYYINLIKQYISNKIKQKFQIKINIFSHMPVLVDILRNTMRQLEDAGILLTVKNNQEENWNYYSKVRFNIFLYDNNTNEDLFLGDGGDTTWTQQLMGDKKERYMISGLGSELFVQKISELMRGNQ